LLNDSYRPVLPLSFEESCRSTFELTGDAAFIAQCPLE
jgi:hypothetical protein